MDRQTPYCWLLEGKAANAELEFVVQHGAQILPIEVKSGKSGSLKSLLQFIAARECTQAIKFSLSPFSEEEARHEVVTSKGVVPVRFTCHHLPL